MNQQVDYNTARPIKRPEYNKERDIFRGSSSSNFFNNKNGGKENDEDYEDTAPNRNADVPKKKIIRKLQRKEEVPTTTTTTTPRNNRPTGFVNNFAGSSFVPSTTGRTISTTSAITPEQYTTAIQNYRGRQRGRTYNNADNFRGDQYRTPTTPSYNDAQKATQGEQFRGSNQPRRNEQYRTPTQSFDRTEKIQTTSAPYRTDNRQYKNLQRTETSGTPKYDTPRISSPTPKPYSSFRTENYPSTVAPLNNYKPTSRKEETPASPQISKQPFTKQTENYPSSTNYKKPTTFKSDNYPTTYSPKVKNNQYFQKEPSTPIDYSQPKGFDFTYKQSQSTTPRSTTQHTQYTPTVPKQSSPYYPTTQAPKLAKSFDYDDGSYNPKYNDEHYNPKYEDEKYKEDEFLKTAHSQNFASSRNELQSSKINLPIPTKESPRPFSATTQAPKNKNSDPKVIIGIKSADKPTKKEKDNSYDYAYYDTNVGSEPDTI